jgi:hypothetical protein
MVEKRLACGGQFGMWETQAEPSRPRAGR